MQPPLPCGFWIASLRSQRRRRKTVLKAELAEFLAQRLGETAALPRAGGGDHVRQQQREGLVADEIAGAPDRMAKAERRLLAREAHRALRQEVGRQGLDFFLLTPPAQCVVELVGDVEMVL